VRSPEGCLRAATLERVFRPAFLCKAVMSEFLRPCTGRTHHVLPICAARQAVKAVCKYVSKLCSCVSNPRSPSYLYSCACVRASLHIVMSARCTVALNVPSFVHSAVCTAAGFAFVSYVCNRVIGTGCNGGNGVMNK
jgi:hypothetical protein